MTSTNAYSDPATIASLGGDRAAIDGGNCQMASLSASKLCVLMTSGDGREAAGWV